MQKMSVQFGRQHSDALQTWDKVFHDAVQAVRDAVEAKFVARLTPMLQQWTGMAKQALEATVGEQEIEANIVSAVDPHRQILFGSRSVLRTLRLCQTHGP